MMKLTKPQQRFLADTAKPQGERAIDSYPPARRLLELGFVSKSGMGFGHSAFHITPAGREALQKGDDNAA